MFDILPHFLIVNWPEEFLSKWRAGCASHRKKLKTDFTTTCDIMTTQRAETACLTLNRIHQQAEWITAEVPDYYEDTGIGGQAQKESTMGGIIILLTPAPLIDPLRAWKPPLLP